MSILVKKMESDAEIKGKAFVHWKAWQEAYPGIVPQSYLDKFTLEKREATAYQWLDNVLIAKDGERVVGFIGYGKYRNDELPKTGEVYAIYVLSQYWGQGVGSQLMREALNRLRDFPQTAVWGLKENHRAIRFYERFGYRFDGREEMLMLDAPVTEARMILKRSYT